jgi:DegV family protein with EDD domain
MTPAVTAAATIAVVTDSTSYLPPGLVDEAALRVVPVQVVIGSQAYDEGVDITPTEVAAALREWQIVTTSRPSPERFAEFYAQAAAGGATGIVSVHLSSDMSGTYESAVLAARRAELPTRVVDSRSVGMALGFAVMDAVAAAAAGGDLDVVATAAADRARRTSSLFYVDTLDYLRRGGRIGAAQALLGQALAVKPILTVTDGRVTPLEKVRTATKALARLHDLAVERADGRVVDLAVHHLDAAERAEALADRLAAALPGSRLVVSEVGAVVGAHVGPGMIAVVVAPR